MFLVQNNRLSSPGFCSISFNTLSHKFLYYPLLSKMVTSCQTCVPCLRQQRVYTATWNTQYISNYLHFVLLLWFSMLSQPEVKLYTFPEDPHTHQHTYIPYCHTSSPLHPQVVIMFPFHNSQQIRDHSHKHLLLSVI